MSFNLSLIVHENARIRPNSIAVIDEKRRVTYSDLMIDIRKFSNMLGSLDMKPGDKIAILMPNSLEYPVTFFGVLYAGCVAVPLNILLTETEIAYHLADSDTKAIVVAEELLPKVKVAIAELPACKRIIVVKEKAGGSSPELISFHEGLEKASKKAQLYPTHSEDPAVIIYTSGTTGKPKGAMLSHSNLFMNAHATVLAYGKIGPGDVSITALPLFQSGGMTLSMTSILYSGAAMTIIPKFNAERALYLIDRDHVTFITGVPTMYIQLLGCGDEKISALKNLKLGISAGAPLPIEILNTFREQFDVKVLLEAYGLTECSPMVTFQHAGEGRLIKPGSIGEAMWGLEVGIMNDAGELLPPGQNGEIVAKGHSVMLGYYNRPEATKDTIKNGWLHTGDIGNCDEDGHFYFSGRIKEMIIRGGYNIYPKEVEDILYKMDGLVEASVIGVPDEILGEEICACLTVKPSSGITEEKVISHCKKYLAKYKYPRKVNFYEELPKNSTGKILKRELIKDV